MEYPGSSLRDYPTKVSLSTTLARIRYRPMRSRSSAVLAQGNEMRRRTRDTVWLLLGLAAAALLVAAPPVVAQDSSSAAKASAKPFKPEELEQIVAPIALYTDGLVAQVLMASTYPLEVVEAARFAKDNARLKGDALNQALKKQSWDDSVKSLVSFPQILTMMSDKLDWIQKLGDAFLGEQKDTMDAIQRLRAKAQAAGHLKSNEQQKVVVETAIQPAQSDVQTIIKIEPANPQVVYVPTYNPAVVYGVWPYPAYPPYYYYPPGYAAATAAVSFGMGMAVGAAVWGGCNWSHGDVNVNVNNYSSFSSNVNTVQNSNKLTANRGSAQRGSQQWQHDPAHRRGVQYRDAATQQRFNRAGLPNPSSRESFRGRADAGRQSLGGGAAGQFGGGGARGRDGGFGGGGSGTRSACPAPRASATVWCGRRGPARSQARWAPWQPRPLRRDIRRSAAPCPITAMSIGRCSRRGPTRRAEPTITSSRDT
jgi:hypothetical protein